MNKKWTERLVLAVVYLLLISFAATASYIISDQAMRMLNTILVLEETHAASLIRLLLALLLAGLLLIPSPQDQEASVRKALNRTLREGMEMITLAAEADEEKLPDSGSPSGNRRPQDK